MRQLLTKLGLAFTGGNYSHLKKRLAHFNVDISHFKGQSWAKGLPGKKGKPSDYLIYGKEVKSSRIK